jgi:hypothetical protein
MIEVLGIHVGDDDGSGAQAREGAVALVGLDHHPFAFAHAGVGAVGVDDAAIDDGGVLLASVQQGRDHRRGCGLAVGAADGDGPLQAHDFGQHFGAAYDRHAASARGVDFRIAVLDRGGNDDDAGMGGVLGLVADADGDAALTQALDIGAVLGIGAGDLVAQIFHHLGDTGHADAADADEMDWTRIKRNSAADHELP